MHINASSLILDRDLQKATMQTQYQQILARLDQRIRSALNCQDYQLYEQLKVERRSIQAQLP